MQKPWARRHIVIVNWRDLDHPQAGGAEVYAENIAAELASAGATVTLLAARPKGLPAVQQRRGFTIRRAGGTLGVYPAALLWLLVRRRQIDGVLDCQNGIPFFTPIVLRRRTPVIQVIHHVHQRQFRLFFGPMAAFVGKQLESRGARRIYGHRPSASVSPSTRSEVREVLRFTGPRFLVPNGLELPTAESRRQRSPNPTIVCVGRLVPHKRIELLLAAVPALAAAVPHLVIHLVGDGPDEERLHALAKGLDIPDGALIWHGRLSAHERDGLLSQAWLTVNPTHGEGWGLGVMEAAAWGVPALAFRVQGLRDSIRDGSTGWLIEEGSPLAPALIQAINALYDERRALHYRTSCLEWSARFTWTQSANLFLSILTAEERRRARIDAERRSIDDVTTVIQLDGNQHPQLRATDVWYHRDGKMHALLYGADLSGAEAAFTRSARGIPVTKSATTDDHLFAASADPPQRL